MTYPPTPPPYGQYDSDGVIVSTPEEESYIAHRMAIIMRMKLAANRGKLHWKQSTYTYLVSRLLQELDEMKEKLTKVKNIQNGLATGPLPDVWEEAADIANFAAMLADKAHPLEGNVYVPRS